MSEALSSSEIEDVLSSIRRLVSDDLRPAAPRPGPAGPAPAGADKLILTPALRVVQTGEPRLHLQVPQGDLAASDHLAIEDVVAQVAAGVDQQLDAWESETGDVQPMAEVALPPPDEWMLPETGEEIAADWSDETLEQGDPGLTGHQPDPYHLPEDPEQIVPPPPAAAALPGWAQEADSDDEDMPPSETWAAGTVEPDAAWADEAEAEVLEELGQARAVEMEEDEFVLHREEAPAGPTLDEDMLREIVRDIIREELQGRLGERITRNIRKLVRAEIARVMAADDLA